MPLAKPADKITPEDLEKYPVWTFDTNSEGKQGRDETWMVPVKKLPVTDLSNCICLANARLAGGKAVLAVLGNIDLSNFRCTDQFINLSFWLRDKWWHLNRAHNVVSSPRRMPDKLANVLRLRLDEVFPISYDISQFATGPDEIVKGSVGIEPREKLSRAEMIALAVRRS